MSADTRTDDELLEAAPGGDTAEAAAVNRYARAVRRLKDAFQGMPGRLEDIWG